LYHPEDKQSWVGVLQGQSYIGSEVDNKSEYVDWLALNLICSIKATNYSAAVAGFINTSGEALNITQDISDVTADNWSVAAAGVIKNVDFKDLRPSSKTAEFHFFVIFVTALCAMK
jgi:hypothetical protein